MSNKGSKRGFIVKSIPVNNDALASQFLARDEEEIRRELEADIAHFGQDSAMALISKSNLAMKLQETNPEMSLKLHREVLQGKIKIHGSKNVTVGITYNAIGQVLKTLGRYEEAIENLSAALKIRESISGEEIDAAITRDELGCCYQALGLLDKAREIRLSKGIKHLICSNESCSKTAKQRGVKELSSCAQCKCIWYCSPACQKMDWKKNHKKVCKPTAASSSKDASGGGSSSG